MKKVSIIVPLYKSEQFIHQLINSVINQSYKNIELILVDDESPDNCGTIADDYAKKDNRIIVIHKKNGGCCDARNAGLQCVSGEYLTFLDGDDWMENDCIEYLVSLMEDNKCDMSMTDRVFTTYDFVQVPKDNIKIWTSEEAACGILYMDIPVGPWNKLYTTKIVKDNQLTFSVPWFGEGLYFSVMSAQYSSKVAVGHRKVYHYSVNNPNSGTTLKNVKNALSAKQNIHYIKDNLVVRTEKTVAAANYHILLNNLMVLDYIYSSKTPKNFKDEIDKAIIEYRLIYPEVNANKRIHMNKSYKFFYYFPVGYTRYIILKNHIKEKSGFNAFKHWLKAKLYFK